MTTIDKIHEAARNASATDRFGRKLWIYAVAILVAARHGDPVKDVMDSILALATSGKLKLTRADLARDQYTAVSDAVYDRSLLRDGLAEFHLVEFV